MRQATRRAQEMQRLVERWERSGLTQAAFAREAGMPVNTFAWWRQRLRVAAVGAGRPRAARAQFVEVVPAPPPAPGTVAEVVLRNGWVVRVPLAGVDAAAVRTLAATLDAPC